MCAPPVLSNASAHASATTPNASRVPVAGPEVSTPFGASDANAPGTHVASSWSTPNAAVRVLNVGLTPRALSLAVMTSEHHRAALLSDLPQPFADEADGDACPAALGKAASEAPKLGRFVFARAKRDIGDVEIDPSGETAYFEKDDVHVLRYEGVQSLVHSGDLALI